MPQKFTAEQIKTVCPQRLQQIAEEIEARRIEADKQLGLAANHQTAIDKLLDEARGLCDEDGFTEFCTRYCGHLKKSQAYAMRKIIIGEITLEDHRAKERNRKQKSRAKQKATAPKPVAPKPGLNPSGEPKQHATQENSKDGTGFKVNNRQQSWNAGRSDPGSSWRQDSGTVPENSDNRARPVATKDVEKPGRDQQGSADASYSQRRQPNRSTALTLAVIQFNDAVTKLIALEDRRPDVYAGTSVSCDDLAEVGNFLVAVAELKKSNTDQTATGDSHTDDGAHAVGVAEHTRGEKEKAAA